MPRAHTIPANQRVALSLADAAASLSLSLNAFNEILDAGEIPLVRRTTLAGTTIKLVMLSDLETWARQHRDQPHIAGKRRPA
jgi:hypothetical protein